MRIECNLRVAMLWGQGQNIKNITDLSHQGRHRYARMRPKCVRLYLKTLLCYLDCRRHFCLKFGNSTGKTLNTEASCTAFIACEGSYGLLNGLECPTYPSLLSAAVSLSSVAAVTVISLSDFPSRNLTLVHANLGLSISS